MSDDEELGAITAPAYVHSRPTRRTLEPHPATGDAEGACELCCRPARGYRHPDPLRPGVVLWRCARHRFPASVVDDPKAAPGGGRYR